MPDCLSWEKPDVKKELKHQKLRKQTHIKCLCWSDSVLQAKRCSKMSCFYVENGALKFEKLIKAMKSRYNCRKHILWDKRFVGTCKKPWHVTNNCENLWQYHLSDVRCCTVHLLLLPAFLHPAQGTLLALVPHARFPTLHVRLGLCSLAWNLEVCSDMNICAYCCVSIKKIVLGHLHYSL